MRTVPAPALFTMSCAALCLLFGLLELTAPAFVAMLLGLTACVLWGRDEARDEKRKAGGDFE